MVNERTYFSAEVNWKKRSAKDPLMRRGVWVALDEDKIPYLKVLGLEYRKICAGRATRGSGGPPNGGWVHEHFVPLWEYAVYLAMGFHSHVQWKFRNRLRLTLRDMRRDPQAWRAVEATVFALSDGSELDWVDWVWMLEDEHALYEDAVRAIVEDFERARCSTTPSAAE